MKDFKRLTKSLPTLTTALLMAMAVWILAVTNTDPVERRTYNRPVPIELIGQDASLVLTSNIPDQVTVTLSAPLSVWGSALNSANAVRAVVDLAGLSAGVHQVPVRLQINARPVKVENFSPDEITIQLEELVDAEFEITLIQPGNPPVGFDANTPILSARNVVVSGPTSLVTQVAEVRAVLDVSQERENIDREVALTAVDRNGQRVNGVSINPDSVNVKQEITQRGGYRNVSVKVITTGQIASGYRLTNISSNPLVVTVFSTDPDLVNILPGFVETVPLDLTDAEEDLEVSLALNLPAGVIAVGESTIRVSVAISPIQGSVTLAGIPIEIIGSQPDLQVESSPDRVDVIFSGPLPTLDRLKISDIRVLIDLTNKTPGIYQVEPLVEINIPDVLVESILPATIEVEISPITTRTP